MANLDLNHLIKEIKSNDKVNSFIKDHNLETDVVNKNLTSFLAYLSSENRHKKE